MSKGLSYLFKITAHNLTYICQSSRHEKKKEKDFSGHFSLLTLQIALIWIQCWPQSVRKSFHDIDNIISFLISLEHHASSGMRASA